jgi:hypothetical protein
LFFFFLKHLIKKCACIGTHCIPAKYILVARHQYIHKMSDRIIPHNHDALFQLLNDPMILRLVTVVNLASLSILELLEYNFTRKDVSRALAKGVVKFDKTSVPSAPEGTSKEVIRHVLETGDYYFGVLSSKLRLSYLGLYILETIEEQASQIAHHVPKAQSEQLLLKNPEDTSKNALH